MKDPYMDVAKYLLALKKEAKTIENGSVTITVTIRNGVAVSCDQAVITKIMADKEGEV